MYMDQHNPFHHTEDSMFHKIIHTDESWTGTVLRLAVALVIFPHGAQKLLGWFGGYGLLGTMGFLTGTAGLPWLIALAVIMIEFFGSLSILAGLFSRIWSLGLLGLMTGIILTVHVRNGFFMNWSGAQSGEGFEFHLLVIGIAFALIVHGSGKFSMDRMLLHRAGKSARLESQHQAAFGSAG